jgi:TPR repeat protein
MDPRQLRRLDSEKEKKWRIYAILVSIPRGAMKRHRKQLARTLVLASALIASAATFLLPPSLQAQTQAQPKGIDPALLATANAGDANSQFLLGLIFDLGQDVPQDYKQAAAWYLKAAEQGNAKAEYYLGLLCQEGLGVPKNDSIANEWFRKAAEQGDMEAEYNLGLAYAAGVSVPKDLS